MANGNYGNGPSQARWIVAAVAGALAFFLSKFAWHQGFWWALLIGIVVLLIVLLLWSLLGGQSDPGYGGATGTATGRPDVPVSPAAKTGAIDTVSGASPAVATSPVMAQAAASEASVTSAPVMAAPVALMSVPVPAVPKARTAKPAVAKAEKAPKAAAKVAAKPAIVKAETAPKAAPKAAAKPAVVKAETAPKAAAKPAVVKAEKAPKAPAKPVVAKATGPELLKAPRGGKADDLKLIEGIGPALEKLVNGFGVYHFDQIAKWTAKDIAFFDGKMERFSGRITRDKWVAQAKIIGKEGIEAFLERAKTNNY